MDSAFAPAAYPAYTTDDLRHMLRTRPGCEPIMNEIYRRERVEAGEVSAMTAGERLAHVAKLRKGA